MDADLAGVIKAALGSYPQVRDKYYEEIFVAIYDYLDGDGAVTKFRNDMTKAMVNAFLPASEMGWEDGGGTLPIDDEALKAWVTAMQASEIEHINVLFQKLKELRKGDEVNKTDTATARAEGYCRTLDTIYNRAKVAGAGKIMLTFVGDDGAESCADCQRYKGKRHTAQWWIQNDAVPPNRDFECKGYNCQHVLISDKNEIFTL